MIHNLKAIYSKMEPSKIFLSRSVAKVAQKKEIVVEFLKGPSSIPK